MADTHIKINAVTPRVQYIGDGSTTSFPYSFAIFDDTDMVVYVGDDVITTGYTVTGAGQTEGGNVVFDTAPENGVIITLLRNVPIERVTDFQEGGTFRPKNLNDEFDRQTAFAQQVQEALTRCVKVDPTSESNPEEILPKVERLYDSADNIDIVANDKANVDAVAGNQTNIDAVAGNENNINTVAGISSDVSTVANISQSVSDVADNETNINKVSNDLNNIDAVAEELPDVKTKANKSLDNLDATGQAVIDNKVDLNLNNMNPSATAKETIVGWGMPDYTSAVSVSSGSFTPSVDGVLMGQTEEKAGEIKVSLGNIIIAHGYTNSAYQTYSPITAYVSAGETYTIVNSKNDPLNFYPLKGTQNA